MTRRTSSRRRALAAVSVLFSIAACSSPQLAAPPEVTVPPTTTPPPAPTCTPEEAALDPTRSYAPDGPLPPPGDLPAGSTMAEIRDRGQLVVGVSADTLLFGSVNPNTGDVEGFDVDLLQEVAKAIFGDGGEERITYRIMPFGDRIPALQSGEVDLVAHTMTINCGRWLDIAFSSTYYDAGKKVLVPQGSGYESIDDLVAAGARVCAPSGSTSLAKIKESQYTGVQIVEAPDVTACLVALQQGQTDAIIGDDTVLLGLATQDPTVEVVGEPLSSEPYGIGVNGEQVDLVQFVNGVLEELRTDGRWAEIYEEWLPPPAPEPPPPVYGR